MPDMAERLAPALTPQQVADLLSVTADTVNRWADEGKLVGFKSPGGRWRFRRSDVEALLNPEPVK